MIYPLTYNVIIDLAHSRTQWLAGQQTDRWTDESSYVIHIEADYIELLKGWLFVK